MSAARTGGRGVAVFEGTGDPLFDAAAAIRRRVFIEEQSVPEIEEWDDIDAVATHVLAMVDGEAAGTLRCHPDDGWWHVGRVAVLPEYRGKGVASLIVAAALEIGRERGFGRSFLNAQSDKMALYEKHGYAAVGAEFMEANIPHFRMEIFF